MSLCTSEKFLAVDSAVENKKLKKALGTMHYCVCLELAIRCIDHCDDYVTISDLFLSYRYRFHRPQ